MSPPHDANIAGVHLQGNKTLGIQSINNICRGHTIYPGFQPSAAGLYLNVIPIIQTNGYAGLFIVLQIGQPAASGFVINASAPRTLRMV